MSILDRIKPCDTEKPYIFISYSSLDRDIVWKDVHEFQKRGFNIWLDERNIDKTKPSWKDDAIAAVEDFCCELVLLYVSANSLTSEACCNEMKATTSERTLAYHGESVKYIAVEVEPVVDIIEYSSEIRKSVQQSGLTKQEKLNKLEILHSFIRDFFNTNNEKVRVHSMNDPSRTIDYYDEIIMAFPAAAKIEHDESSEAVKNDESEVDQIMAEAHEMVLDLLKKESEEADPLMESDEAPDEEDTPASQFFEMLYKGVYSEVYGGCETNTPAYNNFERIPNDVLLRMTESVEDDVNGFWVRNNTFDDANILESIIDGEHSNNFYDYSYEDNIYGFLVFKWLLSSPSDKYMIEYEPFLKGILLTDKQIYQKDLNWSPSFPIKLTNLINVNKLRRNEIELSYRHRIKGIESIVVKMPTMQRDLIYTMLRTLIRELSKLKETEEQK